MVQYVSGCQEDNCYDLYWCWDFQWMFDVKLVEQIGIIVKVGIDWVVVGVYYGYVVQQQYYYQGGDEGLYVVFCYNYFGDCVDCCI